MRNRKSLDRRSGFFSPKLSKKIIQLRKIRSVLCKGNNARQVQSNSALCPQYTREPPTPQFGWNRCNQEEISTGVNLLARVEPSIKVALTDATQAHANSKSPTVTNHQYGKLPTPKRSKVRAQKFGLQVVWGGGQVTRVELPLSTSASCGLAGGCRTHPAGGHGN